MEIISEKNHFTFREAAEILGLPPMRVTKAVRAGDIRTIKIPGYKRPRIHKQEIERHLDMIKNPS